MTLEWNGGLLLFRVNPLAGNDGPPSRASEASDNVLCVNFASLLIPLGAGHSALKRSLKTTNPQQWQLQSGKPG